MLNFFKNFINGAKSILTGYAVTLREFFRPPETLYYPWEKWELPDRYRGKLSVKGFFDRSTIEKKGECYEGKEAAPCMRTCPACTDARGYLTAVAERRFRDGVRILKNTYPFPGSLGRVCPAPCESDCSRNIAHAAPLTIRFIKRFLADYDRSLSPEERVPFLDKAPEKKGIKVAVVGAGPAGMTCAWELAKRGYDVTVFEKLGVAGGYLATGIPSYRLPRDVLNDEIQAILDLGVELKLNTAIGRDKSYDELFAEGYRAIFIGVGATKPVKLGCEGEECSGVIPGEDFLEQVNLGMPHKLGKRVAVIGGGNTAIDCARVAKRLGAEVTILYRRTKTEMPADPHEIQDCIDEGIALKVLAAPVKVIGTGSVSGIECINCRLGEADASGRRKPVPMKGSEFMFECDTILTALSRTPDIPGLPEAVKITKRGTIEAKSDTGATAKEGIFAAGDVSTGAATVVEAIAGAKRAADAIDRYLSKK